MTVDEFCARYMDGMTPVPWQREAIELSLDGGNLESLRPCGRGGGRTTVLRALERWWAEREVLA